MLSFRLHAAGPASRWMPGRSGWVNSSSYIRPFDHPNLEHFCLATGDAAMFVVRERIAGVPSRHTDRISVVSRERFEEELTAARQWPLEQTIVVLRDGAAERATVYAGAWGTAPLYVTAANEALRASWDPAEIYPLLQALDDDLALEFLVRCGTPYAQRTVIKDLLMLTERAVAHWTPAGSPRLRIEEPPPVLSAPPRPLKTDADVLGAFGEILTASMARWIDVDGVVAAAELSGGLDSAIVAAVAARRLGRPLRTYGLRMPPPTGEPQAARRQELIDRFAFVDRFLDAAAFPPLADGSRAASSVIPWLEFYTEAFDALAALARKDGATTLLTGIGGDELLYLHRFELTERELELEERDEFADPGKLPPFLTPRARERFLDSRFGIARAPQPAAMLSAVQSAGTASPLAMRRGLWPVHPLCTPELVRFCSSLPREWREQRALERRFLAQLGCGPSVTNPEVTESFSGLMDHALRTASRSLLETLFAESRLADAGLIDPARLRREYRRYCAEGREGGDVTFWAVAILELTMRSLESAGLQR